MQTDNGSFDQPCSYYGKKTYYINPFYIGAVVIPKKVILQKNKLQQLYEDIAVDSDK
jgi:hypothetical protein